MRFGYHFYNWDRAWDHDLELRLSLTRETGWEGFEAKPQEIGETAERALELCRHYGIACAAVGGDLMAALDYAAVVGARIVRAAPPQREWRYWADLAGERGIEIVVHPHVGAGGKGTGKIETREDLLRYLDDCPGLFACPDTGHLALCGSDPVRTIRDLGERVRLVHLKDIDLELAAQPGMKGSCFCDLGKGGLDLKGVMSALESIGFAGWVMVERDQRVPDYVASARDARAALRALGY